MHFVVDIAKIENLIVFREQIVLNCNCHEMTSHIKNGSHLIKRSTKNINIIF